MLGNLDSPDTIGPSMAVALIGTLYGAVMANLICIPMGEKLSYLSHEEMLLKQIIIKGILAIQAGDNPRIVRQKLDTFLPPKLRQRPGRRRPKRRNVAGTRRVPSDTAHGVCLLIRKRLTTFSVLPAHEPMTTGREARRRPGVDGLLRRHDHHHDVVLRHHVRLASGEAAKGKAQASATAGGHGVAATIASGRSGSRLPVGDDAGQFARAEAPAASRRGPRASA